MCVRPNVRAEPTLVVGRFGPATDHENTWLLPAQSGLPLGVGSRARG